MDFEKSSQAWLENSPVYRDDGILDYFMVVSLEISRRREAEIQNLMLKEIITYSFKYGLQNNPDTSLNYSSNSYRIAEDTNLN